MIGETSLMMGFTFIVGMAFAYVLKLMTFFFSRLNGTEISALLRKAAYGAAPTAWTLRVPTATSVRSPGSAGTFPPIRMRTMRWTLWPNTTSATPGDAARQDSEMTRLYELHHGTV